MALNERERKIYDLVVMRFLSVFYPPFEYEQVSLKVKIGNEMFTATGKTVINLGYKAVYKNEDDDDEGENQALPPLKRGDRVPVRACKLTEGKTRPPAPFNEATLLTAMESPAQYMETKDKALAETLKNTGGLGTVATRADIIEKLFDNFLIEKKGKEIFSTSKGRQLLTLVPGDLKAPELTGVWEQKLLSISKGQLKKDAFLQDIRGYTRELIIEIKNSTQVFRHDNLSTVKCTVCGKFMLQVAGKKGEMLVCQDRECNHRVNLSLSIRSKCPKCFKWLKIVGEGEKRKVVCICGHKENYESFEKRKAEENDQPSKRELDMYMDKINKDEPKNNPFASLKDMMIAFEKK
jgi:DNA topoisomerase-3